MPWSCNHTVQYILMMMMLMVVRYTAVLEPILDGDKAKDYLATYVNPTLLHALSALCRHKPAQPIVRSLSLSLTSVN